jgi:hypothetical protein
MSIHGRYAVADPVSTASKVSKSILISCAVAFTAVLLPTCPARARSRIGSKLQPLINVNPGSRNQPRPIFSPFMVYAFNNGGSFEPNRPRLHFCFGGGYGSFNLA